MLFLLSTALAFDATSPAAEAVLDMEPRTTRAGFLKLQGPALEHPDAAEALAWRLAHVEEPLEVQAAVARALAATGEAELVIDALAGQDHPEVRGPLLDGLRRADDAESLAALRAELSSDHVDLRMEAARVLSYRADAGPALVFALYDPAPEVRGTAARGIGWIDYDAGFDALVPLLGDADPEVVKHADRSLDRLDAARAAELR